MNKDICIGNDENKNYSIAILTGCHRSGKTTLGMALSSNAHVGHSEDYWLHIIVPILVSLDKMDAKVAGQMLNGATNELVNDAVLFRSANFRIKDQTSIWRQKNIYNILRAILFMNARSDVNDYLQNNKYLQVLNLPSVLGFIGFLDDVFSNLKVVNVVRNCFDVAIEMEDKNWWSDESLMSKNLNTVYRKHIFKQKELYVPWWVKKGEEDYFCELNNYERSLYCWIAMVEVATNSPIYSDNDKYMVVRFEDMIGHNNVKCYSDICDFLDIDQPKKSNKKIEKYFTNIGNKSHVKNGKDFGSISEDMRNRILEWQGYYGYI